MTDHVLIAGPASWNLIVELDRLPEPVPHMQFALGDWETVGGTSAGKALSLAALGRPVALHTLLGGDVEGERVRRPDRGGRRPARRRRCHDRAPPQPDDP
jgi:acarbose 7IV-phosphotransferase